MTISEEKAALRRWAASLPRAEAACLPGRFLALPQVKAARTVLLFDGVGAEPDTRPLLRALLESGRRAAYPVCLPGNRLELRLVAAQTDLIPGRYGVPAPGPGCPVVTAAEIGAALVPHVLCDRENYRLGRGGGYYDRFLAEFSGFSVCFCPTERLVDRLPRDRFDRPVDLVLTD